MIQTSEDDRVTRFPRDPAALEQLLQQGGAPEHLRCPPMQQGERPYPLDTTTPSIYQQQGMP